jgi:hypothetical protein
MRVPGTRLVQTFSFRGEPDYAITGYGHVERKIAEQIIGHAQIVGGKDALFPNHHQTWQIKQAGVAA